MTIAVLVIGGGTYFYSKYSQKKFTQDVSSSYEPINTQTLLSCENIKKQYNRYGVDETNNGKYACYTRLAIANRDILLCDKISDTSFYKGSCRSSVAIAKQDLSLCDTLPNERGNFGRDACYAAIGGEKHGYEICNKIPEDNFKDSRERCIEDVARRKGECEVIPKQAGKDYCYLYQSESVQVTARDKRCDVYKEPKLADLCGKHLRGEITLQTMCGKIVDAKLQRQCLTYNINSVHVDYGTNKATVTE